MFKNNINSYKSNFGMPFFFKSGLNIYGTGFIFQKQKRNFFLNNYNRSQIHCQKNCYFSFSKIRAKGNASKILIKAAAVPAAGTTNLTTNISFMKSSKSKIGIFSLLLKKVCKAPTTLILCNNSKKKIVTITAALQQEAYNEINNSNIIYFNRPFDKSRLKALINWSICFFGEKQTVDLVETLKLVGYSYATKAGISLSIDDLKIPKLKNKLLVEAESKLEYTSQDVEKGYLTSIEYFAQVIDTWNNTSERIKNEVIDNFKTQDVLNPVYMMAFSGARGNISQVRQLVGMRGLMADPSGRIIDFPIQSNFREGLTLTEYVISCYGARKGVVDTALRTATSGYLTRRLVDVAQHVIIRVYDCGTKRGVYLADLKKGTKTLLTLKNRLIGRVLAEDVYNPKLTKEKIANKNQEITNELARCLVKNKKPTLVRSALTCQDKNYVCQLCYGWSLSHSRLVPLGESVGIIAAQSIGEPGTQLTMRTFHTGGVFSGDVSEEIRAPFSGFINFNSTIAGKLVRTTHGQIAFLTKQRSFLILTNLLEQSISINKNKSAAVTKKIVIPAYSLLFVKQNQKVREQQVLAESPSFFNEINQSVEAFQTIYSEFSGEVRFKRSSEIKKLKQLTQIYNPTTNSQIGEFWILSAQKQIILKPINLFLRTGDFINLNSFIYIYHLLSETLNQTLVLQNTSFFNWFNKKNSMLNQKTIDFSSISFNLANSFNTNEQSIFKPFNPTFTCVDKTIFKKHNYFSVFISNKNYFNFFSQKRIKTKTIKNLQLKQFWKGSFNILQNYYTLNYQYNKPTYFLPNFKPQTGVCGLKQAFFITINSKNKFVTLEQNSSKNSVQRVKLFFKSHFKTLNLEQNSSFINSWRTKIEKPIARNDNRKEKTEVLIPRLNQVKLTLKTKTNVAKKNVLFKYSQLNNNYFDLAFIAIPISSKKKVMGKKVVWQKVKKLTSNNLISPEGLKNACFKNKVQVKNKILIKKNLNFEKQPFKKSFVQIKSYFRAQINCSVFEKGNSQQENTSNMSNYQTGVNPQFGYNTVMSENGLFNLKKVTKQKQWTFKELMLKNKTILITTFCYSNQKTSINKLQQIDVSYEKKLTVLATETLWKQLINFYKFNLRFQDPSIDLSISTLNFQKTNINNTNLVSFNRTPSSSATKIISEHTINYKQPELVNKSNKLLFDNNNQLQNQSEKKINLDQRNRLIWFSNEQKILTKQSFSIGSLAIPAYCIIKNYKTKLFSNQNINLSNSVCPSFKKLGAVPGASFLEPQLNKIFLNKNRNFLFEQTSATKWSYLQKLPFCIGLEKFSILSQNEKISQYYLFNKKFVSLSSNSVSAAPLYFKKIKKPLGVSYKKQVYNVKLPQKLYIKKDAIKISLFNFLLTTYGKNSGKNLNLFSWGILFSSILKSTQLLLLITKKIKHIELLCNLTNCINNIYNPLYCNVNNLSYVNNLSNKPFVMVKLKPLQNPVGIIGLQEKNSNNNLNLKNKPNLYLIGCSETKKAYYFLSKKRVNNFQIYDIWLKNKNNKLQKQNFSLQNEKLNNKNLLLKNSLNKPGPAKLYISSFYNQSYFNYLAKKSILTPLLNVFLQTRNQCKFVFNLKSLLILPGLKFKPYYLHNKNLSVKKCFKFYNLKHFSNGLLAANTSIANVSGKISTLAQCNIFNFKLPYSNFSYYYKLALFENNQKLMKLPLIFNQSKKNSSINKLFDCCFSKKFNHFYKQQLITISKTTENCATIKLQTYTSKFLNLSNFNNKWTNSLGKTININNLNLNSVIPFENQNQIKKNSNIFFYINYGFNNKVENYLIFNFYYKTLFFDLIWQKNSFKPVAVQLKPILKTLLLIRTHAKRTEQPFNFLSLPLLNNKVKKVKNKTIFKKQKQLVVCNFNNSNKNSTETTKNTGSNFLTNQANILSKNNLVLENYLLTNKFGWVFAVSNADLYFCNSNKIISSGHSIFGHIFFDNYRTLNHCFPWSFKKRLIISTYDLWCQITCLKNLSTHNLSQNIKNGTLSIAFISYAVKFLKNYITDSLVKFNSFETNISCNENASYLETLVVDFYKHFDFDLTSLNNLNKIAVYKFELKQKKVLNKNNNNNLNLNKNVLIDRLTLKQTLKLFLTFYFNVICIKPINSTLLNSALEANKNSFILKNKAAVHHNKARQKINKYCRLIGLKTAKLPKLSKQYTEYSKNKILDYVKQNFNRKKPIFEKQCLTKNNGRILLINYLNIYFNNYSRYKPKLLIEKIEFNGYAKTRLNKQLLSNNIFSINAQCLNIKLYNMQALFLVQKATQFNITNVNVKKYTSSLIEKENLFEKTITKKGFANKKASFLGRSKKITMFFATKTNSKKPSLIPLISTNSNFRNKILQNANFNKTQTNQFLNITDFTLFNKCFALNKNNFKLTKQQISKFLSVQTQFLPKIYCTVYESQKEKAQQFFIDEKLQKQNNTWPFTTAYDSGLQLTENNKKFENVNYSSLFKQRYFLLNNIINLKPGFCFTGNKISNIISIFKSPPINTKLTFLKNKKVITKLSKKAPQFKKQNFNNSNYKLKKFFSTLAFNYVNNDVKLFTNFNVVNECSLLFNYLLNKKLVNTKNLTGVTTDQLKRINYKNFSLFNSYKPVTNLSFSFILQNKEKLKLVKKYNFKTAIKNSAIKILTKNNSFWPLVLEQQQLAKKTRTKKLKVTKNLSLFLLANTFIFSCLRLNYLKNKYQFKSSQLGSGTTFLYLNRNEALQSKTCKINPFFSTRAYNLIQVHFNGNPNNYYSQLICKKQILKQFIKTICFDTTPATGIALADTIVGASELIKRKNQNYQFKSYLKQKVNALTKLSYTNNIPTYVNQLQLPLKALSSFKGEILFSSKPQTLKANLNRFNLINSKTKAPEFFYLTDKDLMTWKLNKRTVSIINNTNLQFKSKLGQFISYGTEVIPGVAIPQSGQILAMEQNKIVLRRAKAFLLSSGAICNLKQGAFVNIQSPLLTLTYKNLKTEDIVQGIPKIEQLFEARENLKEQSSLNNLVKTKFQHYKKSYAKKEAVRKSVEFIQQYIVDAIQHVYQSQAVNISDKHIEIIVKQMTSKVRITEVGSTGLLTGDIVYLDWVELVNSGIEGRKAQYEPIILGITKASLEMDGFISAASFQETIKILSRAAILQKRDFLRGLKENLILGHLLPAGTGFELPFKQFQLNKTVAVAAKKLM